MYGLPVQAVVQVHTGLLHLGNKSFGVENTGVRIRVRIRAKGFGFGFGFGSRLGLVLRQRLGLCYSTYPPSCDWYTLINLP